MSVFAIVLVSLGYQPAHVSATGGSCTGVQHDDLGGSPGGIQSISYIDCDAQGPFCQYTAGQGGTVATQNCAPTQFSQYASQICGGSSSYTVSSAYSTQTGGTFTCNSSQYIDIGLRVKEQGVTSPTPVAVIGAASSGMYDFGGIYGSKAGEENPLTGTLGCPAGVGYTSIQILKALPNFNSNMFYCYRPAATTGGAEAEFGGIYIRSTNNSHDVTNPFTGAYTCPSGFSASPVFGFKMSGTIFNPGYTLVYCYKPVTAVADGSRDQNDFGGMSSQMGCGGVGHSDTSPPGADDNCPLNLGTPDPLIINNPATSLRTCPSGYSSVNMTLNSLDGVGTEQGEINTSVSYCINADNSPLFIAKNGTTYKVSLVDPSDPAATTVYVTVASGIKALRRFVAAATYNFPDKYTTATGHCSGPSGPSSFYGSININNLYGYSASFARTQFSPILNETAPSSFSVSANSTLAKSGFGSISFNNCPVTPPSPYGSGTGSATYSVTINGSVVDTVMYTWDYAI